MSATSIPATLINLIREGNVALVLGAGASVGAIHPKGDKIPLGPKLAEMLSDNFLAGEHRTDPLAQVAEMAASERSLPVVQDYIKSIFMPFQPGAHHQKLPTFKWHGIATLNYDLIVERSYSLKTGHNLATIYSDADKVEDKVVSPSHLLFLKLHGCITITHDSKLPLILTVEQYVTHRQNRMNLFKILEDWARDKTLIFVGSSMQDSDIRQVLQQLGVDSDWRNRHYLVVPHISSLQEKFWQTRKIEVVRMGFSDFLTALDAAIPLLARAIAVPAPTLPCFARFNKTNPVLSPRAMDVLRNDLEWVHPGLGAPIVDPKDFYRGAGHGWGAIIQKLDVHRTMSAQILSEVVLDAEDADLLQFAVIKAPAGAGKSVLLKRIAWTAADELDALCFFVREGSMPSPELICEICESASRRVFIFVEDFGYDPVSVAQVCGRAAAKRLPITIIGAVRTNEWNVACEPLKPFVTNEYMLPYLSKPEIAGVIALLEKHGALGTLQGKTHAEREVAFTDRAGRQLLVALHEATLGARFEKIVRNEYEKITPVLAQSIYLTICSLNRTGVPVRAGLISRIHGITFEDFAKDFLGPLEQVVLYRKSKHLVDIEYIARHPHIADMVFREVLDTPRARLDALTRIIENMNLSFESDNSSFEHLVRARTVREWLPADEIIDEFFALARRVAPNDGHVWLQSAIAVMNRPEADLRDAEHLLEKAHELMPGNPIVTHSFAELECRLSEKAPSMLAAERHINRAIELAKSLVGNDARTAHGFTTIAKAEILRLRRQLREDVDRVSDEIIGNTIKRAEDALFQGVQKFGDDSYLSSQEADLAKLLADETRAVKALELAVSRMPGSVASAVRLSRAYTARGEDDRAIAVLRAAIDNSPTNSRLHMTLAEALLRQNTSADDIEYHLSKAFSPSDQNREAQFLYARQLYVNGKISLASEQFERVAKDSIGIGMPRNVRLPWMNGMALQRFQGTVTRLDMGYGFLERDGERDRLFFSRSDNSEFLWREGAIGSRVSFGIGFRLRGPVAVELEKA